MLLNRRLLFALVSSAPQPYLSPLKTSLFESVPVHSRIVEVGSGPGSNDAFIAARAPSSYSSVDPNPFFSADYATTQQVPSASADVVVATFVLCSADVLGEIYRIVRPGGLYVFLEHVLSENYVYAAAQRAVRPLQEFLADGCDPTKTSTLDDIRRYFDIEEVHSYFFPIHFPVGPMVAGVARRP